MDHTAKPRVLFVYYTFTKQALKVTEDMESVFQDRGWDTERAQIEFIDPRYTARFEVFPLRHRYLDILRMLPAQLRRATGKIKIPPQAATGDYDLVVIDSPTWWLTTCKNRERYLGIKIPPTNLQPDGDEAARVFAGKLVDALAAAKPAQSA